MFSNPLGLLALLGIPAILAVHFLQRRARRLPVSTWFLLEQVQRTSAAGRRFERLKSSLPMWLQLVAVLLLTWVLAAPRYPSPGAVCRIAVVVDSSASMHAFLRESVAALEQEVSRLRGSVAGLEITLMESSPRRERLFSGISQSDALAALAAWTPPCESADPQLALRSARSLVGPTGHVIWLTDTPGRTGLPAGVRVLSAGAAIENVGFTGALVFRDGGVWRWRAMVKNHSPVPVRRTWRLVAPGFESPMQSMELAGGAVMTLQADWPTGLDRARLELSADRFVLDDVLPMVLPMPKQLLAAMPGQAEVMPLAEKLTRALDSVSSVPVGETPDFRWISCKAGRLPDDLAGSAVIWLSQTDGKAAWLRGGFSAVNHPLVDGLNWQSLLIREGEGFERNPSDQVLLWQEQTPRIWLRAAASGAMQLVCNIDPLRSNLVRQPAFVVLLHRFCEALRTRKPAPQSLNLETGQSLQGLVEANPELVCRSTGVSGEILPDRVAGSIAHAPQMPGFFEIRRREAKLLDAAVAFVDSEEADFSRCAVSAGPTSIPSAERFAASRPDPLRSLWLGLMMLCLFGSWLSGRRSAPMAQMTAQSRQG